MLFDLRSSFGLHMEHTLFDLINSQFFSIFIENTLRKHAPKFCDNWIFFKEKTGTVVQDTDFST